MLRKLIPLILIGGGIGAGIGAGLFFRPAAALLETAAEDAAAVKSQDYVKLNNQFVVPVLKDGRVISMVILSLNLEVTTGTTEQVYSREPRLRDAFLQVMFDHANAGGFNGSFTDGTNLILLRQALRETAVATLGDIVTDVLIVDIVRQDS